MTSSVTDDRYPIGRFTYDGDASAMGREAAIADIAALPEELRAAVADLSDAQIATPYRDGGWTVRQLVHHVADSHVNAYVRFKLALTEHEPVIKPYDEAVWAKLPDTNTVPISVSLDLLDALHARWVALLRGMSDADFGRTYFHPESKRAVPLREALGLYAWHGKHHTAHVTKLRERRGWTRLDVL